MAVSAASLCAVVMHHLRSSASRPDEVAADQDVARPRNTTTDRASLARSSSDSQENAADAHRSRLAIASANTSVSAAVSTVA